MTAVAHIALAEISARSETGGSVSLLEAIPIATGVLRSQADEGELVGASVVTVFAANGPSQFWRITNLSSSGIWLTAGDTPVASPEGGGCWYLAGMQVIELAAVPGQRIAMCE